MQFFKASALWADAFYKSICLSVCLSHCENPDSSLQQCRQRQSVRELFYAEPQLGPVLPLQPLAGLADHSRNLPPDFHTTWTGSHDAAVPHSPVYRKDWTLMTADNNRQPSAVTMVRVTVVTFIVVRVTLMKVSGDSRQ